MAIFVTNFNWIGKWQKEEKEKEETKVGLRGRAARQARAKNIKNTSFKLMILNHVIIFFNYFLLMYKSNQASKNSRVLANSFGS